MKKNPDKDLQDKRLRAMEAGLRDLANIPVPTALSSKLMSTIPRTACASGTRRCNISLRRTCLPVAAVIAVGILIFALNYGPSLLPRRAIPDSNLASPNYTTPDYNSALMADINRPGFVKNH